MSKTTLIVWLVIACLASPPLLDAQEKTEARPQSTAEIIERILELRREMEALLEVLPPELQEEIERRWQEIKEAEAARDTSQLPRVESTGRAEVAVVPPGPEPVQTATFEPRPESTAQAGVAVVPIVPEPETAPASESIPVADHRVSGKSYHRDACQQPLRSQSLQNLGPVHLGQGDVQQDEIRGIPGDLLQGLASRFVFEQLVVIFEDRSHQQTVVRVVFDDGHFPHGPFLPISALR